MENERDQWKDDDSVEAIDNVYVKGLSIVMLKKCWDDIYGWCRAASGEVSGMGLVAKEGGRFKIYDVFLPEQEGGQASTELTEKGKAEMIRSIAQKKIPTSHLKFWWHTHYNFSTFWSGTDIATCETLAGNSADWMVSMVINQAGDYKARIDIMKPFRLAIDDMNVVIEHPVGRQQTYRYKSEVAKAVKEKSYSFHNGHGHMFPGFHHAASSVRQFWNQHTKQWEKEDDDKLLKPAFGDGGYYNHGGQVLTKQEVKELLQTDMD